MASSRLIYLFRSTLHSDTIFMQCSKNVISSAPSCLYLKPCRRNCSSLPRDSILPISPLLLKNHSFGAISQFSRNYAINQREDKSTGLPSSSHTPKPESSKLDSPQSKSVEDTDELQHLQKLSLYGRIKAMYRDYWYVLVPVHVSTSIVWFGCFYYAASSGIDIIAILETLHFSESVVSVLRDSSAGYFAVAYALYKIFTPVRYTVTLGGTTWAIRFLRERGLIKPRRPLKEAKEKMQEKLSAMKLKREKEKES